MFPATFNTKKPFLFCINYFGKVIRSEMFLQQRNVDSCILSVFLLQKIIDIFPLLSMSHYFTKM